MGSLAPFDRFAHPLHATFIYKNPDEQISVTADFIQRGLERNERCVFLDMPDKLRLLREALAERGIHVPAAEAKGALVLDSKRDFLDHGHFAGGKVIEFLDRAVNDALAHGFSALRPTGDMNWELGGDQDFHLLVDYEARLDEFVRTRPIVGMCQYQRYSVSSLAICNALQTHETVLMGSRCFEDNLFYEPPEVRLEPEGERREQRRGEWMCRQLLRSEMH